MKKIVVFFILILMQNVLNAQSVTKEVVPTTDSLHRQSLNNNSLLSAQGTGESIPSPEQQGFDKISINGKTVYMKKVDNIIIEYKPE